MTADKATDMNLGDYLLEKEFQMNETAEQLLAENKIDPDKTKKTKKRE